MKVIPFQDLYNTSFFIKEPIVKGQNWYNRNNFYNCIGKPKPTHTLLWFKNCSGKITDAKGDILDVARNQMVYMAKGLEYHIEFIDTDPEQIDTVAIHFQLTDASHKEIAPILTPFICIKNVEAPISIGVDRAADEFGKNIVCMPEITSVVYQIFAHVCHKQRKRIVKSKFKFIRDGIELMENNSDMSLNEIAKICGVSEGYFRRLFKEYSGENPVDFRQNHRIEKAKQLLLLDTLSVGEVAEELHFSDIYHFSKTFKKIVGTSPQKYISEVQKKNAL